MDGPFDAIILEKLGIDDDTAKQIIEKCQAFFDTLSSEEHDLIQRGQPTWEEAAKAIDPAMTARDLQSFVIKRGLKAPIHAFMCIALGPFTLHYGESEKK